MVQKAKMCWIPSPTTVSSFPTCWERVHESGQHRPALATHSFLQINTKSRSQPVSGKALILPTGLGCTSQDCSSLSPCQGTAILMGLRPICPSWRGVPPGWCPAPRLPDIPSVSSLPSKISPPINLQIHVSFAARPTCASVHAEAKSF